MVQSVVVALRVLEQLAEHEQPVGVTELALALATTKNRIHRHLRNLVDEGYAAKTTDGRYRAGARLAALGRTAGARQDLAAIADAGMRSLRDALGHAVYLGLPEAQGVRAVASVPGRSVIEIRVKLGSALDFHCSALGKIALAFGPEALRNRVLAQRLEARTPKSIVRPALLRRELERVRRRGWAGAPNENVIGLNALAAPIFDAGGGLAAVLAIVDSIQFLPLRPSAAQVRETLAAARRISAVLGYKSLRFA